MAGKRVLAVGALAVTTSLASVPALAAWLADGSGDGAAKALTLAASGTPTVTNVAQTTATVGWTAAAPLPAGSVRYWAQRSPFATTSWVNACQTSETSATTAVTCNEVGLVAGTDYKFRVTSVYDAWRRVGAESTRVTTPSGNSAPALVALAARDVNGNGKIDRVVAVFDESLATTYAPGDSGRTGWTVSGSGASLASVAVAGSTATLTLIEGATFSTAVPNSFTVALAATANGVRDAAGARSTFGATVPADQAAPVFLNYTDSDESDPDNGRFETGDTLQLTFTEAVVPTWWTAANTAVNTTVTLTDDSPRDTMTISDLLEGSADTGSNNYISAGTATFAATLARPFPAVIRVTLGTCSGSCSSVGTRTTNGNFVFTPSSTLKDAAGNAPSGSRSASVRLF